MCPASCPVCAQVDEVFIMKDNATGTGKGCAFVKMGQKEQALFAISSLNGKHTWEGCPRPMEVRFAESRAQRQMNSEPRGPATQTQHPAAAAPGDHIYI